MGYLIDVPVESGGRLLVEASDGDIPDGLVPASRSGEAVVRARQTLEQALDQIRPAVRAVRSGLAAIAPDEMTVEFGVVLGAETGVVVAKGTTEVHFTVTLNWKRPAPAAGTPAPDAAGARPATGTAATAPLPRAAG